MNGIRERLTELERRDAEHAPCAECRNGTVPVLSHRHPGEPEPVAPPVCGCGRPRVLVVIQYVETTPGNEPLEVL